MSDPRQSHQTAADRILSYLKGTIGTCLLFHAGGDPTVKIFTDSDYANSLDDSRSTFGYCSFLGKSLITWRSKKQREVSLSSTEAELRLLKKGVCEGMWIKDILTDLKLMPQETIILIRTVNQLSPWLRTPCIMIAPSMRELTDTTSKRRLILDSSVQNTFHHCNRWPTS